MANPTQELDSDVLKINVPWTKIIDRYGPFSFFLMILAVWGHFVFWPAIDGWVSSLVESHSTLIKAIEGDLVNRQEAGEDFIRTLHIVEDDLKDAASRGPEAMTLLKQATSNQLIIIANQEELLRIQARVAEDVIDDLNGLKE